MNSVTNFTFARALPLTFDMEIREESLGWKRRNLAQVATFIGLAYVTDVESPVVGISE